jgi:dipeptidase E
MKLLLTSGGIRNEKLKKAFLELLGKPVDQVSVAVIPTASKNEKDKAWFEKDIEDLKSTGVASVEMVDISELSKQEWLPKLESSDVIFVEGGDVYFLRDWAVKSGLADELPRLLQSKLYVGVSAGTRLLNPDISVAALYYDPDKNPDGLGLVDFCVIPHMNSERFSDRTPEAIEPKLKDFRYTTYLIDDNTAIKIEGSLMAFVGGGEYVEFGR